MALGGATAFIGCFAEPAQTETTEEVGTAEQALVRCRVCVDSTSCYDDYCDTRIEYCDHTIGCVPYDSGP